MRFEVTSTPKSEFSNPPQINMLNPSPRKKNYTQQLNVLLYQFKGEKKDDTCISLMNIK